MKTFLDKEAVNFLVSMLLSCMFLRKEDKLNLSQEVFLMRASSMESVPIDEIPKFFSIERKTVEAMKNFFGEKIASKEDIVSFFSGRCHIKVAILEVAKHCSDFDSSLAKLPIFHTLLPVKVTKVAKKSHGEVVEAGIYENGKVKIQLLNMGVFFDSATSPEVGQTILVHYGCVLGDPVSEEVMRSILEEQLKNHQFMEICQKIDEAIDCEDIQKTFRGESRA